MSIQAPQTSSQCLEQVPPCSFPVRTVAVLTPGRCAIMGAFPNDTRQQRCCLACQPFPPSTCNELNAELFGQHCKLGTETFADRRGVGAKLGKVQLLQRGLGRQSGPQWGVGAAEQVSSLSKWPSAHQTIIYQHNFIITLLAWLAAARAQPCNAPCCVLETRRGAALLLPRLGLHSPHEQGLHAVRCLAVVVATFD